MHIALLENPSSGSGDSERVADLLRAAPASVDVFAPDEAADVADRRPDRIVVAGGDGSVGQAAAAAAQAGVPLAVIPVGTANDFAKAMGLPDQLEAGARLAAAGTRLRKLDIGRMGRLPFVNAASVGLPPAAARTADGLKGRLGTAAYAVGAVRAGLTAQPVSCRAACDGKTVLDGDAWQVTIACTGAFGSGSSLDADPADGHLDLIAIDAGSRIALAARAFGMRTGTLESQRGVRSWRCQRVVLDVPERTAFNVDGEIVESGTVSFSVDRRALDLVIG